MKGASRRALLAGNNIAQGQKRTIAPRERGGRQWRQRKIAAQNEGAGASSLIIEIMPEIRSGDRIDARYRRRAKLIAGAR